MSQLKEIIDALREAKSRPELKEIEIKYSLFDIEDAIIYDDDMLFKEALTKDENIILLDWIVEKAPRIANMIELDDRLYSMLFAEAAENGLVESLAWLKQKSLEHIDDMIKRVDYAAFRLAAEEERLGTACYILSIAKPENVKNMLDLNHPINKLVEIADNVGYLSIYNAGIIIEGLMDKGLAPNEALKIMNENKTKLQEMEGNIKNPNIIKFEDFDKYLQAKTEREIDPSKQPSKSKKPVSKFDIDVERIVSILDGTGISEDKSFNNSKANKIEKVDHSPVKKSNGPDKTQNSR